MGGRAGLKAEGAPPKQRLIIPPHGTEEPNARWERFDGLLVVLATASKVSPETILSYANEMAEEIIKNR